MYDKIKFILIKQVIANNDLHRTLNRKPALFPFE